jgi:uncharacterized iron-regulated membrane protein
LIESALFDRSTVMNESVSTPAPRSWPDYRAVWRWHFYAGLFCIPFVIVLSVTGSIYLFKEEIEGWLDRPYENLEITSRPATAADQIKAALAAVPGSHFSSYELPQAPNSAVRVLVSGDGETTRVYLHPESLQVLNTIPEDQRLMKILFRLHGELLLGNRGSAVVELAASWAIVMILTGLFLWWPRGLTGLGGILYPRLNRGSRIFWRDIHSVTGLWISGLALFMLVSGLPWAKFWGDYLRTMRKSVGAAVAQQDWTNGQPSRSSAGSAIESGEHSGHHGHGSRSRGGTRTPIDLAAVDRIVATVRPLELPPPVVIAPPGGRGPADWTAKSMTANRPRRVDLVMDPATGAIKNRQDFRDRQLADRLVGTGIAMHEGRLFGWPNQLLNVCTACGLILVSISAAVMWLRRREPGVLGAPKIAASPRFSFGLLALVVIFGLYLPLFGASLIFVLFLERTVLRRIPRLRDWLGLQIPEKL